MHNLRECQINCVLPTNHEGKHQCKTPKEDHLCDKECSLKDSKRTINGKKCSALCLYKYGHKGICICSKDFHICVHEFLIIKIILSILYILNLLF